MTARSNASNRLRFALDSSCVIALLNEWHEHHRITLASYESLRASKWTPVLPAHVILESFSVMTRLPVPYRVSPDMAELALETSFRRESLIESVAEDTMWSATKSLSVQRLGGGRIYDAAIAFSARRAGARFLLTWNVKHFHSIAPEGLEIRSPA